MKEKKIAVFRVDASEIIGSGHLMRCLTLADELRAAGCETIFLIRDFCRITQKIISDRGHKIRVLPRPSSPTNRNQRDHKVWLGTELEQEIKEVTHILKKISPNLLIVDHYSLDYRWEKAVYEFTEKLVVIDDLADRDHFSDVILDHNLGHEESIYATRNQNNAKIFTGANFAIIRPEFYISRKNLKKKFGRSRNSIVISLGGADIDNLSSNIIRTITMAKLRKGTLIEVIIGPLSPWKYKIVALLKRSSLRYKLHVGIKNVEEVLSRAFLAIGGAGVSSWERCCLGVPSLLAVQAENQVQIAQSLVENEAAEIFFHHNTRYDSIRFLKLLDSIQINYKNRIMGRKAEKLIDGFGSKRAASIILNSCYYDDQT